MTISGKEDKDNTTWNLSRTQLICLIVGAFLLGVNTSIVITQPEGESILGAGMGIGLALIILFNVLYAVRRGL